MGTGDEGTKWRVVQESLMVHPAESGTVWHPVERSFGGKQGTACASRSGRGFLMLGIA